MDDAIDMDFCEEKKVPCVTCQEMARVVTHVRTGVPGTEAVASLV